jgi:hypothetical protein
MEHRLSPELQVFPVDVDFAPPEQVRWLKELQLEMILTSVSVDLFLPPWD